MKFRLEMKSSTSHVKACNEREEIAWGNSRIVLFTSEPRVIFVHVVHCYRRCCNVLVWFFEVLWYFVVKFGRTRGFVAKQTKETKMK